MTTDLDDPDWIFSDQHKQELLRAFQGEKERVLLAEHFGQAHGTRNIPYWCRHCGALIYREAWRVHLACCPALAKNRPV